MGVFMFMMLIIIHESARVSMVDLKEFLSANVSAWPIGPHVSQADFLVLCLLKGPCLATRFRQFIGLPTGWEVLQALRHSPCRKSPFANSKVLVLSHWQHELQDITYSSLRSGKAAKRTQADNQG